MDRTNTRYVVGVDPGATTGIVRIEYRMVGISVETGGFWMPTGDPIVIQCHHKSVRSVLEWLTAIGDVIISHERYVVGSRASRVKKASASQITRNLNGMIDGWHGTNDAHRSITVVSHTASETKPWAIPEKMAALRLELPPEMRHARDAGAQAAYAGCHDLGAPDPLSKRGALAAAYGADAEIVGRFAEVATAGTYSYGIRVTKVGGEPVTDAVITFDTTPVDATVLGGQRVTSDPHPALKAAIDAQSPGGNRYIGLERFIEELEDGNE